MPDSTSARNTFLHVWAEVKAVLVLLVIAVVVIYVVDDRVGQLRTDINSVVRAQCLANQTPGASPFDKYNDQVRVQISSNLQAERLNTAQGFTAKAALNASTAARLKADIIHVPPQDCYKPLIP